MQVATRAAHAASVERLSGLQRDIDTLQGQIGTGKRIAVPSDAPVGSGIVTRLRRAQDSGIAAGRSVDTAVSRLAATDVALAGVSEVVQRAREVALLGATGTLNAADRATLAATAVQLGEQLLELANTRAADGTSLFGGALGQGDAFVRGPAGLVVWAGVGGAPVLALGSGTVSAGIDGRAALTGPAGDAFALLDALNLALAAPDAARSVAMASVLTGLEASVSLVADTRATVGTRQTRLEAEAERLKVVDLAMEKDLSKIEGIDLPTAIARVQRLITVLQAAQASFVKITSLSLWDRL